MSRALTTLASSFLLLSGCQQDRADSTTTSPPTTPPPMQTGAPGDVARPASAGVAAPSEALTGQVIETLDSGGYTYVQLDTAAEGKVWVAGPSTAVEVGDTVTLSGNMLMRDFVSKTLDRTFERIYFATALKVAGGASERAAPGADASGADAPQVTAGEIEPAPGGLTVAKLYAQSAALAGKQVRLRGKVVKFNGGIMGKNWVHLQDGTGGADTHDVTVTTDATVEVGDVVLVEGKLATDKDLGGGYTFAVIVEDASVTPSSDAP